MKHVLLFCCLFLGGYTLVSAQTTLNLLGNLPYPGKELSDIWGYVDSAGNEYALVGVEDGFSIVDISNPAAPNQVAFIGGATTMWRDVKVWKDHAYVTNEGSGGLLIVDLSDLPNSVNSNTINPNGMSKAHNIFIDENGIAYVVGADVGVGGVIFLDVDANATNPPVLGMYNQMYVHDCFARNDTMWAANINDGVFSVIDVSNKAQTNAANKTLATQNTPNNFAHNCWLSDDGNYLFTTDEKQNAFIAAYNVDDLFNISEVDRIQSNPGTNTIPHNTFYHNGFLVTAYYADGITIHDATQPHNLIEVGDYDSSPSFAGNQGGGFHGAWGVYPYLPSGNIIVADIETGLHVLGVNYVHAAFVEGIVTDTLCGGTMSNVSVKILTTNAETTTDLVGEYATGIATAGIYNIEFSRAGYQTKTLSVELFTDSIITLDVQLMPDSATTLAGQVVDTFGNGIPFAKLLLTNTTTQSQVNITTDANGQFYDCTFTPGDYDIITGQWGYLTDLFSDVSVQGTNGFETLELTPGYYDDFILNFDWVETQSAASGLWERNSPIGTTFGGQVSNPGSDVPGDFGPLCYITGNGGGQAGNDDIDGGEVTLSSPIFDLTSYSEPVVSYHRWFFNGGGNSPGDDALHVYISNGNDTVLVDRAIGADSMMSQWIFHEVVVADWLMPTANMQMIVEAFDTGDGHLVEAAFDLFSVKDTFINSAPQFTDAGGGVTDTYFYIVPKDSVRTLCVDIADPDGDNLTPTITQDAEHAINAIQSLDCIQYIPNSGYIGPDTIRYQICDDGIPNLCSEALLVIDVQETTTNLDDVFLQTFSLYPNPFYQGFSIEYELDQMEEVEAVLYDVQGRVVWSEMLPASSSKLLIDPAIEAGTYLLEINNQGTSLIQRKLIKLQ